MIMSHSKIPQNANVNSLKKDLKRISCILIALILLSSCIDQDSSPSTTAFSPTTEITSMPTLSDLVPKSIAPQWNMLLEVPLDPQDVDSPSQVLAAYVRAWQSGNGLIWASVYQFADSKDAESCYNSAKAELRNVTQPETTGNEGVSSTSPLGLKLCLFYRGQYLVMAGSAIMTDPKTEPPDPSLVQNLVEKIDSLILGSGSTVTFFNPALPQSINSLPFLQISQTKFHYSAGGICYLVTDQQVSTETDVEIPLLNKGKENGYIIFRIKVIYYRGVGNKYKYEFEIFIKEIGGIKDDGDGWWRGAGDLFVAGKISLPCGTLEFITKEVGDFKSGQKEPLDFTGGGKTDGRFVGSLKWESKRELNSFIYSIVALVRDNDSDDALDFSGDLFTVVSEVPSQFAKAAATAVTAIRRIKEETVREETEPGNHISNARNVPGDDIGEGNKAGSGTLPSYPPEPPPEPPTEPPPEPPVGGDPPIYQNIMVFPTPEPFLGSDLNNDGDTNDTILRYQNLNTGQVINTGLITSDTYHSIDIYENIIAFTGKDSQICYYNLNTGTVRETGATGFSPSIYGNIIVFATESTVHYFDTSTQTLVDTKIPGLSPAIYQDLIVSCVGPKSTIWCYDLRTETAVDTGIVGMSPALYETTVAFTTPELFVAKDLNGDGDTNDYVIRYYDLVTQSITNTGTVGIYPALHGNRIIFATSEEYTNQDLNGDGKIFGDVLHYCDLKTGKVVCTQNLGTEPDIYEDTITFYVWEQWAGRDLNGDGDLSDPIVDTYRIAVTKMSIVGPEAWLFFLALLLISSITAYFKRKK